MIRYLTIALLGFPFLGWTQGMVSGLEFIERGMAIFETSSPIATAIYPEPLVEKLELRTETHDFIRQQQEYTLRIKFSTRAERKARKELMRQLIRKPEFSVLKKYHERAYELHKGWLKMYILKEEIRILDERNSLLNEQLKILYALAADPDDIGDALQDVLDSEQQLSLARSEWAHLCQGYGLTEESPDFRGMISLASIRGKMDQPPTNPTLSELERTYKYSLAQNEWAMENAASQPFLNFLQVRYMGPHSNPNPEKFSIGAGFTLPFSGNQKIKKLELELELQEREKEQALLRQWLKIENSWLLSAFESAYDALDLIEQSGKKADETLKAFSDSAEGTALGSQAKIQVKMRFASEKNRLKNELRALEKYQECMEIYLDFLDTNDLIYQRPLVNHLSLN